MPCLAWTCSEGFSGVDLQGCEQQQHHSDPVGVGSRYSVPPASYILGIYQHAFLKVQFCVRLR